MRRLFILAVFTVFTCMMITACDPETADQKKPDQKTQEIETDGAETSGSELPLTKADHSSMMMDDRISFTAEYSTYALDDTLFIGILVNGRDADIGYSHCKLERMEDGEWYVLPLLPNILETAELPVLSGGGEAACGVSAELYDHTFTPGKYRIAVYYSDLKEYENRRGKFDHIAFAEFDVTDGSSPEKTVFTDLKDQSLDSARAVSDGCVVEAGGEVSNEEVLDDFIHKAILGMSCEVRIVYPEEQMVRHITAIRTLSLGNAFILETVIHGTDVEYEKTVRSYLASIDGQLVLTNYADPENASALGFDTSQDMPVVQLSEESEKKLQEVTENRYQGNLTIMKLFLDDACSRGTDIGFMIGNSSSERFSIGAESTDAGSELMGDCYPEGLRPVSMSRVSDTVAAIHFINEAGESVTMTLDIYGKPRKLEPAGE